MISKKIRITAFLFLTAVFLTVGGIGTVSAATNVLNEEDWGGVALKPWLGVGDHTWTTDGTEIKTTGVTDTLDYLLIAKKGKASSIVLDMSSGATAALSFDMPNSKDDGIALVFLSGETVHSSSTTGSYLYTFDSSVSPQFFTSSVTLTLNTDGPLKGSAARFDSIVVDLGEAIAAAPDTWHEGFDNIDASGDAVTVTDTSWAGEAFNWTSPPGGKAVIRESGVDGGNRAQLNNNSLFTTGAIAGAIDATSYKYGKLSVYGVAEDGGTLSVVLSGVSGSGSTVEAILFTPPDPLSNNLIQKSYSFNDVENSELFDTDFNIVMNSNGKTRYDEIHLQLSLTPIPEPTLVLNSGATTSSVAAGDDAVIVVQLYDSANDVQEDLTGVSPQLSLTRSSTTDTATIDGVLDDPQNGQVTFTLSGVSTTAGVLETITVTSNVTDWETSNTIVIETVPDVAATVVITGNATTQPDIAIELTGSASDAYGNAITDLSGFDWTADDGSVTPASGATTSFETSNPGDWTVTLTAPSAALDTHAIAVSGTIGSLELSLDPDPVEAGSTVTVTATLYDESGTTPQDVPNVDDIILTRGGSGATEVGTAGGTGEIVFAISSLTSATTETVYVDSSVAGLSASEQAIITTIAGPVASMTITSGVTELTSPPSGADTEVTLTDMEDQYGNAVALSDVDWSTTAGTVSPASGVSAVLTVPSGTTGVVTVTATAGSGATATQDINVTGIGAIAELLITADDEILETDFGEVAEITATATDANLFEVVDLSGIVWSIITGGETGDTLLPATGETTTFDPASAVTGTRVIQALAPSGATAQISIQVWNLPPRQSNPTSGCFIGTAVSSSGSILVVMISAAGGAYTVIRKRKNLK